MVLRARALRQGEHPPRGLDAGLVGRGMGRLDPLDAGQRATLPSPRDHDAGAGTDACRQRRLGHLHRPLAGSEEDRRRMQASACTASGTTADGRAASTPARNSRSSVALATARSTAYWVPAALAGALAAASTGKPLERR